MGVATLSDRWVASPVAWINWELSESGTSKMEMATIGFQNPMVTSPTLHACFVLSVLF